MSRHDYIFAWGWHLQWKPTTCPDVTYPTIDSGRLNSSSSAERVEELEESVWSVVRQENGREDQAEGVQNNGKTSTDVRGRDMGV